MSNLHRKTIMITIRDACKPKEDCDDQHPPATLHNHTLSPLKIMMICILAATFSFLCYIIIIKICRAFKTRWRRRIRTHELTPDQTHQDLIDEDHEPVVFHPIWLINTVGLDQSVIDSIQMFNYRKEVGFIDGTGSDCAVCLGSFQEEESLRLLPKCSHAFHVACVDAWLRSHKTCPLCRAPVVNDSNHQIDQNFVGSVAQEDNPNPFGVHQNGLTEVENVHEIRRNFDSSDKTSFSNVQTDLTHHCSQGPEPMRRSVSLGSFCFVDQEIGEPAVRSSQKPNMMSKSMRSRINLDEN
ncbi:hypothetical protein R6Q57_011406 [Mikania cordata]